jgi:hypothetical protein
MRNIFIVILINFFLTFSSLSEIRVLDEIDELNGTLVEIKVICVDGNKFLMTFRQTKEARAVSTVQIFEERDGKSLPAKC